MKLPFNIHYVTYPLLVVVALASLYWYGGYKQKQADQQKARADSVAVVAKKAIEAKHIADSLFADSVAKFNAKIKADDKAIIVAKSGRDDALNALGDAVKINAHLDSLFTNLRIGDSISFAKDSSAIKDRDGKILFLTTKIQTDSSRYDALAKLNTSTNQQLAKAIADAHPGIVKRIIQNWDILAVTVAACHLGKC